MRFFQRHQWWRRLARFDYFVLTPPEIWERFDSSDLTLRKCPTRRTNSFYIYIHLFITFYMFWAHSTHYQERHIVSIQPLVRIILFCWPNCVHVGSRLNFQPANNSATNIERLLPEVVLIQFVSPDNEHYVLETCRES
jgi:hypothetical protein